MTKTDAIIAAIEHAAQLGHRGARCEGSFPVPRQGCWVVLLATGSGPKFAFEVDEVGLVWQDAMTAKVFRSERKKWKGRAPWATRSGRRCSHEQQDNH